MKKLTISSLILLLTAVLLAQNSHAQDYNRWSLPEGALMRLGKGDVRDVVWSPDGTRLAVGTSPGIWLYDARTGAEVSLITGHSFRVNAVAFSPDGLTLASGSRDHTVRLWDVATGQEKSILTGTYQRRRGGGILAGWDDVGKRRKRLYGAGVGRGHRGGTTHAHGTCRKSRVGRVFT